MGTAIYFSGWDGVDTYNFDEKSRYAPDAYLILLPTINT